MTTTASNALYIFDCGVRETRMQFYRTFREPKLYRYAKKFEYDKIVERCTSNPKAAAREAKFRHDYPPQQTPLHLVLEPLFLMGNPAIVNEEMREKRHSAAAALLEANRNAALMCCTLGTTPITMVCVDPYASLKDVDMLIRVSPKSLLIPDIEGRLPLHYACINNRSNLEMLKMLLTACPEAAFAKDKLNRLPLHYAVMASPLSSQASGLDMLAGFLMEHSSKAPTSTVPAVELMLQANKKGAAASDGEGMTPLFHLCHYMNSPNADLTMELFAVLDLLVRANRSVAKLPHGNGVTPLAMLEDLGRRLQVDGDSESDAREKRKEQCEALERIVNQCSSNND